MVSLLEPAQPEVREAAENVRRILTHLRAAPLLERLERVVASRAVPPGSESRGAVGGIGGVAPVAGPMAG